MSGSGTSGSGPHHHLPHYPRHTSSSSWDHLGFGSMSSLAGSNQMGSSGNLSGGGGSSGSTSGSSTGGGSSASGSCTSSALSSGSGGGSGPVKAISKRKKSTLSEVRILVLGDRNVGKSALVVRFLTRRYIIEYEHGMDNRYKAERPIGDSGEPVIFDILDPSSASMLAAATSADLQGLLSSADVILLVYSITDRTSFNFLRNLLRHFAQCKAFAAAAAMTSSPSPAAAAAAAASSPLPLVAIVGNKCDLVHLRQVSEEEGEILATEYAELSTAFMGEVTAAEGQVAGLFGELAKWVKRVRPHTTKQMISLGGLSGGLASGSRGFLDRMMIGITGGGMGMMGSNGS